MGTGCPEEIYEDDFNCPGQMENDGIPPIPTEAFCQCTDEDGQPVFVVPGLPNEFNVVDACGITFPPNAKFKTLLNGQTISPWVKIGFQKYDKDGNRCEFATNQTIITTGNLSQPGILDDEDGEEVCRNPETRTDACCHAVIKSFQYGWGAVNSGNRCKVTIVDQLGSSFRDWVQRLIVSVEGAAKDETSLRGVYQMKVQFGWFVGGGDADDCGKKFAIPGDEPNDDESKSFLICSPILWFLPDKITVNSSGNKFLYELEGVDLLVRGQQHKVAKIFGSDTKPKFFVDAVKELAQLGKFNIRFLQMLSDGRVLDNIIFAPRCGEAPPPGTTEEDLKEKGPFQRWPCYELSPLAIIHKWIKDGVVAGLDNGKEVGITVNYDSTFDCPTQDDCECEEGFPEKGQLCIWADGIPSFQPNQPDDTVDGRMRAFYVVNGGNCLDGATVILTEDGWQRVNNLVKFKYNKKIACVDKKGNFTWSNAIGWYRNLLNDRALIKIHLHNSRHTNNYISGGIFTEDHEILTNKGYIEVRNLKISEDKIHSGTYQPSNEIHQAIIGMVLGDANIRARSYAFDCTHSLDQEIYGQHKARILNLESVSSLIKNKIRIRSKASPYWRSLRKLFYPDGIKVINKKILDEFSIISLAYLFMDDGHLKTNKKLAEIATCCFKRKEVKLLLGKLEELGISGYLRKNSRYPRIYFNREETAKLSKAIAPYVVPSMNYKLLEEDRDVSKKLITYSEQPFFDTFDLIRCKKLENKTKYVYCIDVENHHNFITHSGVVHNCSPVYEFNPMFRWNFQLGLKSGGGIQTAGERGLKTLEALASLGLSSSPGGGFGPILATQVPGIVSGGREFQRLLTTASNPMIGNVCSPQKMSLQSHILGTAANLITHAIEAELKVQGDPDIVYCTPLEGYGRTVGIVFINPYFLTTEEPTPTLDGCPGWSTLTDSVCNDILTNKAWFIKGVEHQITETGYTTILKLVLPAPGAELFQSQASSPDEPVNLGGWSGGSTVPQGGTSACVDTYPAGMLAANFTPNFTDFGLCPEDVIFTGGGTACDGEYATV